MTERSSNLTAASLHQVESSATDDLKKAGGEIRHVEQGAPRRFGQLWRQAAEPILPHRQRPADDG